ncbi:DUF1178 family protein [uncultured Roseobacter sp.]|uniref:DUF1178 family protein n=1 Tax=uncultured Roseobacter sp. TaxID=114847 RepID=UPI0026256C43|nr:DUF1178 family protein [uncultured Roseobacter sp.]
MIQYALKCDKEHAFDSWFQSAAAFDALKSGGHLSCAVCGSSDVSKAIMAPRVATVSEEKADKPLQKVETDQEKALTELRRHVEENADYVGPRFAEEARSMYLGTTPERAIYGEANGAEAKALIEDGVPVAPLPFLPNRKAN